MTHHATLACAAGLDGGLVPVQLSLALRAWICAPSPMQARRASEGIRKGPELVTQNRNTYAKSKEKVMG